MRPSLVVMFVLAASGTARAGEKPWNDEPRDEALYPVQLTATAALGPLGVDGRWGLSFERHPARGFGFGYGGSAGYAALADPTSTRLVSAFFASPTLRPGYYFFKRGDTRVSGVLGVAIAPIIDVTTPGDVRFALTAQPGFIVSVERFTFGLSMLVGATIVPQPGFYVGAVTSLGVTI